MLQKPNHESYNLSFFAFPPPFAQGHVAVHVKQARSLIEGKGLGSGEMGGAA